MQYVNPIVEAAKRTFIRSNGSHTARRQYSPAEQEAIDQLMAALRKSDPDKYKGTEGKQKLRIDAVKKWQRIAKVSDQKVGQAGTTLVGTGKKNSNNAWIKHLAKFRKAHPGMSVPEAAKAAKKTYHKQKGGAVKLKLPYRPPPFSSMPVKNALY